MTLSTYHVFPTARTCQSRPHRNPTRVSQRPPASSSLNNVVTTAAPSQNHITQQQQRQQRQRTARELRLLHHVDDTRPLRFVDVDELCDVTLPLEVLRGKYRACAQRVFSADARGITEVARVCRGKNTSRCLLTKDLASKQEQLQHNER